MSDIIKPLDGPSTYKDNRSQINVQKQRELLAKSTTLYCGNLSFYTTEEQIYELFSRVASGQGIKRIIMGLDRNTKTPCGFAFVEYYTHEEALEGLRYISGTKLDERIIRCDLDAQGYKDGRQFGRGRSGGQVRDEYRTEFDSGRGGWGHLKAKLEIDRQEREKNVKAVYANVNINDVAPSGAHFEYDQNEPFRNTTTNKRERDSNDNDDNNDEDQIRLNSKFRESNDNDF